MKSKDVKNRDFYITSIPDTTMNRDGDICPLEPEEEYVVIKKEKLEDTLPILNEMTFEDMGTTAKRAVTKLSWNGPIMDIKGYYYLEDMPLPNEDVIKKSLLLINQAGETLLFPLMDIPIHEERLSIKESIDERYLYAGFEGRINFAMIGSQNKPLSEGDYEIYLSIEVKGPKGKIYKKHYPLGNVLNFLPQEFYATKMEFFSAKREIQYNLLVTYNKREKTLHLKSKKLKDIDPADFEIDKSQRDSLFNKFMKTKVFRMAYRICKLLFPIKQNKVIFASDSRAEMSGNFQFVYEEMESRNLDFDYHFMLKDGVEDKKSSKEIMQLAYHMATAKFIMLDDFYPMVYPLKIRKHAELIQLWHAVGAFKTFGFSRLGRPGGPSPRSKNHRNYTKAIVSSDNIAKHYAEGFGIEEENVVATGIPRTDIFFDEAYKEKIQNELYEEYPFLKNKKVIMFAPTFRGNGQQSAHYPMEVLNLDKLYESLNDEYVFLFKIHPFVKNEFNIPYQYNDFFYDFSTYREINDLLFITDILITDYSSVCFEFALLNKPMLFFGYDVEEYVQTRDFYYNFQSFIPGPLVRDTETMIDKIEKQAFEMHKIEPFVKYFFNETDGKSSERVVDHLILGIDEEENI